MIKLEIDLNVGEFLDRVSPVLEREAAIHSFLLSLAARKRDSGNQATLCVRGLDDEGLLAIAGLQTDPERPLTVPLADAMAARELATLLWEKRRPLNGVNGPVLASQAFADAWAALSGCELRLGLNLRLFELTAVTAPVSPSGSWREAGLGDVELIIQWNREFLTEAAPHDPVPGDEQFRMALQESIPKKGHFVWEDGGEIVCLINSNRDSSAGRWINQVYTPKRLRGRGYASALVAAVSQRYVEQGRKCLLFTDLANPTSNSIYQKVGYRPLADFRHILFR